MLKVQNIKKATQIIKKLTIRKRFEAVKAKQRLETSYQCLKITGMHEIVITLRKIENSLRDHDADNQKIKFIGPTSEPTKNKPCQVTSTQSQIRSLRGY
jgi:spore coat polysaccharide biosynthesis predicted glycosyltransferase SpsG